MSQTIAVSEKTIDKILVRLNVLTQEVRTIKAKLFESEDEPPYGSDEWWKWSDAKALRDIKMGKGTVIRNKKELDTFFKNLKTA